jgi:hypothetical protein
MLFMHSSKSNYTSTMFARAGVQVAWQFPHEVTMRPLARRILRAVDLYDMTYLSEPDKLAPEFKYRCQTVSGESLSNWLWGYWQGRTAGIFGADE